MSVNKVNYLNKKIAKVTIDFSAQNAIDSAYTFDDADISDAADTITIANHPYITGDAVGSVLTAGTGATATVPNATVCVAYWVIYVDKDTIALASSLANAKLGTKVALTAGGATVDQYLQRNTFGLITTDCVIPLGAVVTKVWYDVITTLRSEDGELGGAGNSDLATISIGINAADDVVAAMSIADATADIWDAGEHATLIGTTILDVCANHDTALKLIELENAGLIKTTAEVPVTLTIAIDPVALGKMDIYVEYYEPTKA